MSILTTGGVIKSIRGVIGGVIFSMATPTTAIIRTKKRVRKVKIPKKFWYSASPEYARLTAIERDTWKVAAADPGSLPHSYTYGVWLFSWWYYWSSRLYLPYAKTYPTTIPSNPGLTIAINTCQYSTLSMTVLLSSAAPADTTLAFQLGFIQTSLGSTTVAWLNWFYYSQDSSSISLIDISSQFSNATKLGTIAAGDTVYIRPWLYFTAGGNFNGMYPMSNSPAFIIT